MSFPSGNKELLRMSLLPIASTTAGGENNASQRTDGFPIGSSSAIVAHLLTSTRHSSMGHSWFGIAVSGGTTEVKSFLAQRGFADSIWHRPPSGDFIDSFCIWLERKTDLFRLLQPISSSLGDVCSATQGERLRGSRQTSFVMLVSSPINRSMSGWLGFSLLVNTGKLASFAEASSCPCLSVWVAFEQSFTGDRQWTKGLRFLGTSTGRFSGGWGTWQYFEDVSRRLSLPCGGRSGSVVVAPSLERLGVMYSSGMTPAILPTDVCASFMGPCGSITWDLCTLLKYFGVDLTMLARVELMDSETSTLFLVSCEWLLVEAQDGVAWITGTAFSGEECPEHGVSSSGVGAFLVEVFAAFWPRYPSSIRFLMLFWGIRHFAMFFTPWLFRFAANKLFLASRPFLFDNGDQESSLYVGRRERSFWAGLDKFNVRGGFASVPQPCLPKVLSEVEFSTFLSVTANLVIGILDSLKSPRARGVWKEGSDSEFNLYPTSDRQNGAPTCTLLLLASKGRNMVPTWAPGLFVSTGGPERGIFFSRESSSGNPVILRTYFLSWVISHSTYGSDVASFSAVVRTKMINSGKSNAIRWNDEFNYNEIPPRKRQVVMVETSIRQFISRLNLSLTSRNYADERKPGRQQLPNDLEN